MNRPMLVLFGVALAGIAFASHAVRQAHDVNCCHVFGIAGVQPGNAQVVHASIDNAAMCHDRHGSVQWVGGLYDGCLMGTTPGLTIYSH